MIKEDWENLSDEEQQDIYRKCKESPAYFYNNFVRKEGAREVSDDEFLEMRRQAEMGILKRRSRTTLLLPDECFLPDNFKIIKP